MSATDTGLFDGITSRIVTTRRLATQVLERVDDDPAAGPRKTVVFVHGSVSSALFWQEIMLAMPRDLRVMAIDLRGFGGSGSQPVDATRGLRDHSDDIAALFDELRMVSAHLVGWAMGGGVVMQYALEHPVLSLTLQAPISPYGFGGTRRDGTRLTADDAGCGAGGADPDFVQRLQDHDTGADAPTSPRSVFRSSYVADGYSSPHEDVWVASMLTTSAAAGNYPGDAVESANWPGFAVGENGVLNSMAPRYFNAAGIIDLDEKPPVLWVHGTADAIVSDASSFDVNHLGALGVVPGWPGAQVAPAQEMVAQTRDVLNAYAEAGGVVTELNWDGVGHSPHLERPQDFCTALVAHIESI